MRQQRAEQERRRSALALSVVTALAERDLYVRACEAKAGEALRTMTEDEGLSLREAVEWCGGDEQLSVREATRLRKVGPVAADDKPEDTDAAPDVVTDEGAGEADMADVRAADIGAGSLAGV